MKYIKNGIWIMGLLWLSVNATEQLIELWESGGFWRIFAWVNIILGITLWAFGIGIAIKLTSEGRKRRKIEEEAK